MAHYAKVVNGIVDKVIVAEAGWIETFVDDSPGEWVQTSYNTNAGIHNLGGTPLRKNFAGIGDTYDKTRDAFYGSHINASWVLNETTCQWEAPVTYPDDGKVYRWNEETKAWVETTPIGE